MKEKVLGIPVCVTDYNDLKNHVKEDIENNKQSFIVAVNPEKILKARKDEQVRTILEDATYQIPDGIGVVYASKLQKGNIRSRVTGIDSMEMLCELSSQNGYKIFMYGAKNEVILKAKEELEKKYENINIVGCINGYEHDDEKIVKAINDSGADILFVALGSPKQELWMTKYKDRLNVKIFQGVGGSFDVISGNIKRAPVWMQNCGLEFLYRLIKEPKRIFRQFKLLGFLWLIITDKEK